MATIPIYTGGLAQAQERAALHGHAAAAYQVAGTMAQIRTAVVRSWSQMAAARASITSIRKQQAASKTALDGILAERKLGQRTMSEVVAAQQAALTSDTAYEQRTRAAYVSLCSMPLLMARLDAGAISVVQSIVLSHFAAVLDSNESAVCLVRCIGGEDGPATVRRQSDDSLTIARR